jgi:uncharacterized membrane protein
LIALSAETTRLHDTGSMPFVYLHAVGFVTWMVFVEATPWPTLALVVSLEAIFLVTFVMISRNRQAVFRQITR